MASSVTDPVIGKYTEISVLEVKVLDLNTILRAKTKHTSSRIIKTISKDRRA